jgi:hypothetical protein
MIDRATLVIDYDISSSEYCWSIRLGYGISINQHSITYPLVSNAVKSAKRTAARLGITIHHAEVLSLSGYTKISV